MKKGKYKGGGRGVPKVSKKKRKLDKNIDRGGKLEGKLIGEGNSSRKKKRRLGRKPLCLECY